MIALLIAAAVRIAAGVYSVADGDEASYLVMSPQGHALIDVPDAKAVAKNLEQLGVEPHEIRVLLVTQAHSDHVGGVAELKRRTGAQLYASEADAAALESGGRGDFNFGDAHLFAPVAVDRRLKDGETLRLGGRALTAHFTPGHTKGCTTWSFDAVVRGQPVHVVDVCGLSILDGTRVSGMPSYPRIERDYERSFAVLKALPCDLFLGAHFGYFDGAAKAQRGSFVDPAGYRAYVAAAEKKFREQLARERATSTSPRTPRRP